MCRCRDFIKVIDVPGDNVSAPRSNIDDTSTSASTCTSVEYQVASFERWMACEKDKDPHTYLDGIKCLLYGIQGKNNRMGPRPCAYGGKPVVSCPGTVFLHLLG